MEDEFLYEKWMRRDTDSAQHAGGAVPGCGIDGKEGLGKSRRKEEIK